MAVLTASGTGGMEAAVSNCCPPGSKAIGLIAGRWGERWKGLCKAFGIELVNVSVPYGQAVPPVLLEKALADHPDAGAVFATFSETSTGVRNDVQAYGKLVAATPAKDDADHIRILVDNNPKIPSRITALIDGRGEDPLPVLAQMARGLEQQGADFSAALSGKLKMVAQCAAAISSLAWLSVSQTGPAPGWLSAVVTITIWATVVLTIFSGLAYIRTAIRLVRPEA